jgi:hypothetical protein
MGIPTALSQLSSIPVWTRILFNTTSRGVLSPIQAAIERGTAGTLPPISVRKGDGFGLKHDLRVAADRIILE